MRWRRILGWFWLIVLLVTAYLVFAYRQDIRDWWFMRSYRPATTITAIADQAGFSTSGRRLFYLSDPQVLDKQTFNQSCVFAEFSLVVGCFDGGRIYLLDITNIELESGELVTAAHEMLHAAYQRLPSSEKNRLQLLLDEQFAQLDDAGMQERVEMYRQSPSIDMTNELHSLLGSEVPGLSAELEDYYSQYFTDRADIVAKAIAYNTAFRALEDQAGILLATIEEINMTLEADGSDLQNRFSYLESEKIAIESAMNGDEQPASLNNRIDSYNDAVNLYNRDVASYRSRIEEYETLVNQYKEIALRYEELVNSIDSRYVPSGIE